MPDWMFIWEHDFDTLRELAYEYVQKVVQRYRKAVSAWNVVAGLQPINAFRLNFEQMIELTRLLIVAGENNPAHRCRARSSRSRSPSANITPRVVTSVPPMLYAEMVAQAGVSFEAFGLEIEMGVPSPGMFTRDLFQISACWTNSRPSAGRFS